MALANAQAEQRLGEYMLLSWYDRDRDFELPQHTSECHLDSATPGYVDYAVSHGASLKLDIEQGRFVFFVYAGHGVTHRPRGDRCAAPRHALCLSAGTR